MALQSFEMLSGSLGQNRFGRRAQVLGVAIAQRLLLVCRTVEAMSLDVVPWTPSRIARGYLLVQAGAGVLWWIAVAASSHVREWTMGGWNPVILAIMDLILFVLASIFVALRFNRLSAVVLVGWTALVTVGLVAYSVFEGRAGWGAVIMTVALAGTVASSGVLWFGHLPVSWLFVGPFRFSEARRRGPRANLTQSLGQVIVFWTLFLVIIPTALRWFEGRSAIEIDALDRVPTPVGAATFAAGSAFGLWS